MIGTICCTLWTQEQLKANAQEISLSNITASPAMGFTGQQSVHNTLLENIEKTGATLHALDRVHGLQSWVSQKGDKLLPFFLTPDGKAMVSGVIMNMSPEMMLELDGKNIDHIPAMHGLEGLFVRIGERFQVFYITPDREKVIPGMMWDEEGRSVTQTQIASLIGAKALNVTPSKDSVEPGKDTSLSPNIPLLPSQNVFTSPQEEKVPNTMPTKDNLEPSKDTPSSPSIMPSVMSSMNIFTTPQDEPSKAIFALLNQSYAGIYGKADTPALLVFIDPLCHFSKQAVSLLAPYVKAGKLHLVIVPVAVLDAADHNQSSAQARMLLSVPPDQMMDVWTSGKSVPQALDADQKLAVNQQLRSCRKFSIFVFTLL